MEVARERRQLGDEPGRWRVAAVDEGERELADAGEPVGVAHPLDVVGAPEDGAEGAALPLDLVEDDPVIDAADGDLPPSRPGVEEPAAARDDLGGVDGRDPQ